MIFFLQVSELNKKLDKVSLKGWIRPCKVSTHTTQAVNLNGKVIFLQILVIMTHRPPYFPLEKINKNNCTQFN